MGGVHMKDTDTAFPEEPFVSQLPLQLSGSGLVLARAGKMTLWQQQFVCS
jgi:hypothetical protein